jgi:predicted ATPase/class 3 adenylate cyclase
MAVRQPAGTVTLVFTDIEGSTRLLEELGAEGYRDALAEHRRVVREACARFDGYEVDYEGDAFFYAFASAQAALAAVSEAMAGLDAGPIRVRVGIHTGEPVLDPPKYVGMDVHRAARLMAAAHGGQVVVSASTAALVPPGDTVSLGGLVDLGEHRFKDLAAAERVFQLGQGTFAPLKSLYRSNLPVPATPFLGRERELADVVELLTSPDVRLVTLTGPGGTGKTRLALQSAAEASGSFPDGITLVPLAPLRDPALVLSTLAQALGVEETAGQSVGQAVCGALVGRRALVLLDNLEHLLPAAADAVALLHTVAGPTLLVTSRERLQLQGEQVWPVPALSDEEGLAFFVARARQLDPGFVPDSAAGELCRRLDSLPLALELAAARTAALSTEQLLGRLADRLDLLRGSRDVDPRQRTLRATIEWSYDLLDSEEKRVLRALSVFAGGCTLEAAGAVCDADVDVLESLLDKSLVRRRDARSGPRYWLLETIREYAGEQLRVSGELETVTTRELEYLLAAAHGQEFGSRETRRLQRLDDEYANFRDALASAPTVLALQMAVQLCELWLSTGRPGEGRTWMTRLLSAAVEVPDDVLARANLIAGELATFQDDYAHATEHLDTAERLFQLSGATLARALLVRGWIAFLSGDLEAAARRLNESIAVAREANARAILVRALRMASVAEERLGKTEESASLANESLALARQLGDEIGAAVLLGDQAWDAARRGDYDRAVGLAREALAATNDDGDPAVRHTLALSLLGLGDLSASLDVARPALLAARDRGDMVSCASLLDLVAGIAAHLSSDVRAARLTGAAEALLVGIGADSGELETSRTAYRPFLRSASKHLGAEWRAHVAVGMSMELDDAVALAFSLGEPGGSGRQAQAADPASLVD